MLKTICQMELNDIDVAEITSDGIVAIYGFEGHYPARLTEQNLRDVLAKIEEYKKFCKKTLEPFNEKLCHCVYATAKNTPSVRSGHELGGYVKEECEYCKQRKEAQK